MKYLYYSGISGSIFRAEVTKETTASVWLKYGRGIRRVSKKKYKLGNNVFYVRFYEETPELLERYERDNTIRKFSVYLRELEQCVDIPTMQKILATKENDIAS